MPTRREFLVQTTMATLSGAATRHGQAVENKTSKVDESTRSGAGTKDDRAMRLAIVGTGQISHRYLKQAATSKRARFVATCARSLDSAKGRAVEYGIDRWFDDYTAMYDAVAPDAVVVATPTAVHAAPTIAALERGIHVLCEKPMAATFEDCRAMVNAAQRGGAVFLSMPYDATAPFMAALEHLNEATLGVFTGAEAQLLLPGASRDNWYYDRKIAGGGAGLDTLVYPVSRLISLLGPAQRVTGFVNTLIPHRILGDGKTIDFVPPPRDSTKGKTIESTVDDNTMLLIEWPNGQQAMVRALWGTSIVRNDSVLYGRHGTLWFSGNDVIVHSPERAIPNSTPVIWNGYESCYRLHVPKMENEGLVEHFVDCIKGITKPTCGGQQQLHTHEILFKGYEAARTKQTQQLTTTFTTWHQVDPSFYDTRSRFL